MQQRFTEEIQISLDFGKFGILQRKSTKHQGRQFFHGDKIMEVKQMDGIIDILVQVQPQENIITVRVITSDEETMEKALKRLRFQEKILTIPTKHVQRILGQG